MNTTLTSKGQLTLPKPARDALSLKAGTRLRVEVTADGRITLTPIKVEPLKLYGMLKSPLKRAPTLKEIDAAIGDALLEDERRIRAEWNAERALGSTDK